MNLYFLKSFNNYFDRKLKVRDTLKDYLANQEYVVLPTINFHNADGISASQVVNWKNKWIPNYLIVENDDGSIERWFVIEWMKERKNQYTATLRADVLANNYNVIKTAPIFVEKAMLDIDNPLIYNSEDMTYNQIKVKETLLKDNSQISWLVGYFAQNYVKVTTYTTTRDFIEGSEPIIDIDDIDPNIHINFGLNSMLTLGDISSYSYNTYGFSANPGSQYVNTRYVFNVNYLRKNTQPSSSTINKTTFEQVQNKVSVLRFEGDVGNINADWQEYISYGFSPLYYLNKVVNDKLSVPSSEVLSLNGQLIKSHDGSKYRITLERKTGVVSNSNIKMNSDLGREYFHSLSTSIPQFINQDALNPSEENKTLLEVKYEQEAFLLKAVPIVQAQDKLSVGINNERNHLNDAPYDMFCIPYIKGDSKKVIFHIDSRTFNLDSEGALAMARALAYQMGSVGQSGTFLYDIQLLPYCPIKELREAFYEDENGDMNVNISSSNGFFENKDYNIIYSQVGEGTAKPIAYLFWAIQSSGTFNIEFKVPQATNNMDLKIENETKFLRLCSPNYSGLFEFSPSKNKGVQYVNVDYTYKPFNPYIHINPDFKGLYGSDWNDSRGLIVGGDFSIATLTDAWAKYEIENKNYQQMFDREIKSLDVTHEMNMWHTGINSTVGVLGGLGGGAVAGGLKGGIPGAIGGAVAGGLGGGISMATNMMYQEQSYREQKSFKTDMFNYKLGNIKALPQGIAKTTAFTFNNKVFPFVEEYDCTNIEKTALRNKIIYNGMKTMTVGKMRDFLPVDREFAFFKGQMIQVGELVEDYHVALAIYEELDKGVYLYERRK